MFDENAFILNVVIRSNTLHNSLLIIINVVFIRLKKIFDI